MALRLKEHTTRGRACMGKPPMILYPIDFIQNIKPKQKHLIDRFVKDLESTLGVKRSVISLAATWEATAPGDLAKENLQHYMRNAPTHAFFYDLYHNFDQFRTDFHAKFYKAPYISPMLRWRWNIAQNLTLGQREEAVTRLQIFKQWFLDEVNVLASSRLYVATAYKPNVRLSRAACSGKRH